MNNNVIDLTSDDNNAAWKHDDKNFKKDIICNEVVDLTSPLPMTKHKSLNAIASNPITNYFAPSPNKKV